MKIESLIAEQQYKQATQKTEVESTDFNDILEKAKSTGDTEALRDATDQLEAVFINMMLKSMRSGIPESDGLFKKSESEKMFQEMLDSEYAKEMSSSGGIGISDMLFDQLKKYVEDDDGSTATSFEMKG